MSICIFFPRISSSISPSSFSLDVAIDNSFVSADNNLPTSPMIYGPTMPPSIKDNVYEKSSATYFNDNIKSTTKALSGIVSRAFSQTHQTGELQPTLDESLFHMKVTDFLSKLSGSMHSDFIDILNGAKASNHFTSTRLPRSTLELDKFYLKGKHSIREQLPTPSIYCNHNHAYVSLSSIIDHFLAFGYEPDLIDISMNKLTSRSIINCNYARKIYNNIVLEHSPEMSIMTLFLTFWSDDFEATALRKNTHSTWIKTVSISPPPSMMTSTQYNYIVAIGRKMTITTKSIPFSTMNCNS